MYHQKDVFYTRKKEIGPRHSVSHRTRSYVVMYVQFMFSYTKILHENPTQGR